MNVREALLDAWTLLMPIECAGCEQRDRALCDDCARHLEPHPAWRSTAGGLRVVTALRYETVVRRVILSLKEHNRTDAAASLAPAFAAAIHQARPAARAIELVPVPSSRAAYRRRGHDPVMLLLKRSGLRPARVLRPVRSTARQKTLGAAERADNLRGAFVARRPLQGRSFLLVDDILTTGATLDEASRALTAAGGEVLGAATLAFTPRLFAFRDNPGAEDYGKPKGAQ